MLTPYTKQIEAVRFVRTLISENKNLLNSLPVVPETFNEFDQALNDAGASIVALKRLEDMSEVPNRRAIAVVEKLIERLDKLGDQSLAKEEATNYIVSLKR